MKENKIKKLNAWSNLALKLNLFEIVFVICPA